MSVYLNDDDRPPAQRTAIEAALAPGDVVAGASTCPSPTRSCASSRRSAISPPAMDGLDDNPLPASYEVRLRPTPAARAGVDALGARLRAMPGVADVRYDRQWLDASGRRRSTSFAALGLVLGLVLTLAAALTVANVVRLALFARRDEIEIMQLVGAPQAYIRGPFVMEGVLQGGIGALLALVGPRGGVLRDAGALSRAAGRGDEPVAHDVSVAVALRGAGGWGDGRRVRRRPRGGERDDVSE